MFNDNWYILEYNKYRTVVLLKSNIETNEETLYVSAFVASFIKYHPSVNVCNILSLYSLPIHNIRFKYSTEAANLNNLSKVKKIYLMKYKSYDNRIDDIVKEKFRNKTVDSNLLISIGQIITVTNRLSVDLLNGIYKNDFYHFLVTKIEYEEYDYLRKYVKDGKVNIENKIDLNKNFENVLNSFIINDKIDIEIINNDLTNHFKFIENTIKLLNDKTLSKNKYIDSLYYLDYLKNDYETLHSYFINNSMSLFLIGPSHCGRSFMLKVIADEYSLAYRAKDMNKFRTYEEFLNYIKKTEYYAPAVVHLKNAKRISKIADHSQLVEIKNIINHSRKYNLYFIFSFESNVDIDNSINLLSDFKLNYTLPDMSAREDIIRLTLTNAIKNQDLIFNKHNVDVDISQINFSEIAKTAVGFNLKEIKQLIRLCFENDENVEIITGLIKNNITRIKDIKQKADKSISSIPDVKWADVGGLEHAKEDINDTIQLPIKYPKLFENSLKRRSGLLLYGPPGSGKTLLAKAIANECSMNFISVKGPELLNMYIGESEKNIREVFEKGRANKPCVLFFDEIDALAPSRTTNSDQNNVMDRIVAQFMTEMDGINKDNSLIIIASTNRPDLVDTNLLRPGRFDKMIYIGLPKTIDEKVKILKAQIRNLTLGNDVDINELAEKCPEDYSGADIYSVCSTAFTYALKEFLAKRIIVLEVSQSHLLHAINNINPSLPKSEIYKYEELKKKYTLTK